jgi:hypothetical protein
LPAPGLQFLPLRSKWKGTRWEASHFSFSPGSKRKGLPVVDKAAW